MVSFMNNCGVNKIEQYMRGIESSAHLACFSVPLSTPHMSASND